MGSNPTAPTTLRASGGSPGASLGRGAADPIDTIPPLLVFAVLAVAGAGAFGPWYLFLRPDGPSSSPDYDIERPQSMIVLSVANEGTMEFQLHFTRT